MKNIKNIFLSFILSIITLLITTLLLSIFNYIDLIKDNIISFFMIANIILSTFIGGLSIGRKTNKKGWKEGLKFSFLFIIFLLLINILGFETKLNIKYIIFNIIIIISSVFGGMVGINFKKQK